MKDIIQTVCGELQIKFEDEVMKAVRQVGINVNKEELLKALELADKLVHCKDCRFRRAEDDDMICGFEYGLGGSVRPNIDYCSYGERIEE